MTEGRHLPTSVFTMLAVLIVTLGAAWWVTAAPEPPPAAVAEPAPPARSSTLRLDLGNGKTLTVTNGRSTIEQTRRCRTRPPNTVAASPDRMAPGLQRLARASRCRN